MPFTHLSSLFQSSLCFKYDFKSNSGIFLNHCNEIESYPSRWYNHYYSLFLVSILQLLFDAPWFLSSIFHVFWFLIFSIFLISSCKLLFEIIGQRPKMLLSSSSRKRMIFKASISRLLATPHAKGKWLIGKISDVGVGGGERGTMGVGMVTRSSARFRGCEFGELWVGDEPEPEVLQFVSRESWA